MPQNMKQHKEFTVLGITILFIFILYLTTMLHVYPSGIPVTSGDAAIYANQIGTGDLSLNHIGYLIIGRGLYLISRDMFSLIDITGFLSVLFGTLSLIFCYLISKKLITSSKDALLATLMIAFTGTYWLYSIAIEVYVMQLFFLWGALYFIMDNKPYHSTILFFIGLFVSLTTIFIIPVLTYLAYKNRRLKTFVLLMTLSASLYLLTSYTQIFYVLRGSSTGLHLIAPLANAYYTTQSFLFFLPLAFIGAYKLYKDDKDKLKIISIAIIPYTYFLFFNWDHGVFLLPTYIFISLLAVYAMRKIHIFKKDKIIASSFVIFFLFELIFVVSPVIQESRTYDDFIKTNKDLTTSNILYTRYDYGEIYHNVLNADYLSYLKPYEQFKKELDTSLPTNNILILDLNTSRIDSRIIWEYHPQLQTDFSLEATKCSDTFYTYTLWMGLKKNRYCLYKISSVNEN